MLPDEAPTSAWWVSKMAISTSIPSPSSRAHSRYWSDSRSTKRPIMTLPMPCRSAAVDASRGSDRVERRCTTSAASDDATRAARTRPPRGHTAGERCASPAADTPRHQGRQQADTDVTDRVLDVDDFHPTRAGGGMHPAAQLRRHHGIKGHDFRHLVEVPVSPGDHAHESVHGRREQIVVGHPWTDRCERRNPETPPRGGVGTH